jgi:hypothetical protein
MKKLILLGALSSFAAMAADMKMISPFEPKVAWSQASVKVCWGNETHKNQTQAVSDKFEFLAYTTQQKKWIKDIITKEFNIKEVGIEFTGWQDCPERVDSEVVIFRIQPQITEQADGSFSETGGRATIGNKGRVVQTIDATTKVAKASYESSHLHYLNYVVINTRAADERRMDEENYIKTLALHEFGHTAGLRHAHIRLTEAKADPNCERVSGIKLNEEPVFASTRFAGAYDFNSIMNYCYINVLISRTGLSFRAKSPEHVIKLTDQTLYNSKVVNEKKQDYRVRIGLSQLDKKALKCMYVFDTATREKDCHHLK